METLSNVTSRDFFLGEQGKGYAHVCQGASPFDKIYIEPTANLDHGKTTSDWYPLEITALFDAP